MKSQRPEQTVVQEGKVDEEPKARTELMCGLTTDSFQPDSDQVLMLWIDAQLASVLESVQNPAQFFDDWDTSETEPVEVWSVTEG